MPLDSHAPLFVIPLWAVSWSTSATTVGPCGSAKLYFQTRAFVAPAKVGCELWLPGSSVK